MSSQFRHKQPTRFNEPEIPQDLATKGYVDNLTIREQWFLSQANNEPIQNDDTEAIWFGFTTANPSLPARRSPIAFDVSVTLMQMFIDQNINNNASSITFEIEGTATALLVDIPSMISGLFQETGSVDVDQGEKPNFLIAVGADTTNNIRLRGISLGGIYR